MKLRFLKFFLFAFVLIFAVLNGRFLYANIRFWFGGAPLVAQTPSAGKADTAKPLPDEAILVIEKLGISAPVIFGTEATPKQIYANLQKGVVHYTGSPKPGIAGTSIILGHSSAYPWYRGSYGSVFALLGKLKTGDRFYVRYGDGRVFNFSVKQSVVFSPFKDNAELSRLEETTKSSVVLISCWPIGTDYKRIAVQAELI